MITFTLSLVVIVLGALACIGLGAAGYRYLLKRNPDKLEQWAAQIKAAAAKTQARLDQ